MNGFDAQSANGEWLMYRSTDIQKAESQQAATPNQSATAQDSSYGNRKTPQADLGAQQRIAAVGETIPILFGKRVSGRGGVWIQPSLLKSGSYFFKGSFLFPISQGELVSSPVSYRVWIGLRNLAHLPDQTITVANIYTTAASLESSPGTCPVLGAGMYCGNETYSYITETLTDSGEYTQRLDWLGTSYSGARYVARGSGDTSNSAILTTTEVFDNETGNDLTSAYWAALGLPTNTQTAWNVIDPSNSALGCGLVGVVVDYIDDPTVGVGYYNASGFWLGFSSGSVTFVDTVVSTTSQYFPGNPASTGTLTGIQQELVVSLYADPTNTPTADNSSYADITFLKVTGDIYDPPDAGSFPTTTRQISVFYSEGVKVDLYSVDVDGSTQGASNQIVDLAMYLLTIYKTVTPGLPDVSAPIDTSNMPGIAAFCNSYNMFYNGIISQSFNIIEFLSSVAPYFLLSFQSNGGQYRFEPLLPVNGSNEINVSFLTLAATFSEASIIPGTMQKNYIPAIDRTDISVSVLFRKSNPSEIGSSRSVQVRFSTTALDAAVEQFDMSDFCVVRSHAVLYAKHFLARRRWATHTISFAVPLSTAGLKPTDIIRVTRNRITSVGDDRVETETYQITAISHQADGTSNIEAVHFPLNSSRIGLIPDDVVNGSFKVV